MFVSGRPKWEKEPRSLLESGGEFLGEADGDTHHWREEKVAIRRGYVASEGASTMEGGEGPSEKDQHERRIIVDTGSSSNLRRIKQDSIPLNQFR